jgi:hypothetical protein
VFNFVCCVIKHLITDDGGTSTFEILQLTYIQGVIFMDQKKRLSLIDGDNIDDSDSS